MHRNETEEEHVELALLRSKGLARGARPAATDSWAGGAPRPFADCSPALEAVPTTCALCGSPLYHLVQVYAPTKYRKRALSVLGCNRAACSAQNASWKVVRWQQEQEQEEEEEQEQEEEEKEEKEEEDGGREKQQKGERSLISEAVVGEEARRGEPGAEAAGGGSAPSVEVLGDSGQRGGEEGASVTSPTTAGDDASDWGAVDAADGEDWGGDWAPAGPADGPSTQDVDEDIDAMLLKKERAPVPTPPLPPTVRGKGSSPIEDGPAPPHSLWAGAVFTHTYVMDFAPEPWEASGCEKDHALALLSRYREEEEDKELVALLEKAMAAPAGEGSGSAAGGSAAANTQGGEAYEREPAKRKALLRFQRRLQREPAQVLRYAWGGLPMWAGNTPAKLRIPRCACGQERQFEMQLMPALLFKLGVGGQVEAGQRAADQPQQQQEQQQQQQEQQQQQQQEQREGMEWSVVAVWSCPDSCSKSREEVAIVEPEPETVSQ